MQPSNDLQKRYDKLKRRNYDTEVMTHIALNHQSATRDQNRRLLLQLMEKDTVIHSLNEEIDDLKWEIHELKRTIKDLKDENKHIRARYLEDTGELLSD